MAQLLSQHPFGAHMVRLHRLDNGLQVLLLADRSAPVLAYQTWFAVGSRHEREGTTGIAHLFEHLMFNQTESHPPGELDRIMESVGGDTNAATWVDWTYYRDNLPSEELALAAELEADRMAHLVLGHDQVESEREVVMNERRFRVEDDVDGFLNEELYKRAFEVHPYHWPTIGWMKDIRAISIDDCRAFYRTYYAPNNATVVLVGDFDEARALALLEERYGAIPPAALPPEAAASEPVQTAERRAEFEKPVTADKLRIGYKSPPLADDDYLALEVVSEILFGGKSARLERRLIAESEIASSTSASPSPFRDPGLYEISISLKRGHAAEEAESIIYQEIERLKSAPLSAGELETARTRLLTRLWRELRSHSGRAEALGHHHTTCRDYRRLFAVPAALERMSEADIARVARRYLDERQRTVLIARPSGEPPPEDDQEEDEGDEVQS